jgi:hypothetical protein
MLVPSWTHAWRWDRTRAGANDPGRTGRPTEAPLADLLERITARTSAETVVAVINPAGTRFYKSSILISLAATGLSAKPDDAWVTPGATTR